MSTATIVNAIFIILIGSFAWIGAGAMIDKIEESGLLLTTQGLPMSVERYNAITWMHYGFQLLLVLGIIVPVIIYSIILAKRRSSSEVYG